MPHQDGMNNSVSIKLLRFTSRAVVMRPGQRLNVTLNQRGSQEGLTVPWSAILYDTGGGAWIYENTAPQQFVRRRVEVRQVMDSLALLNRGPAIGAKIVTAGAAELFGTEFGAGK